MQRFDWTADGYPVFGEPISTDSLLQKPSGTPVIKKTWQPAPCTLSTPWGAEVTPDNVLQEYPRPQMVRKEWKNLNGLWKYAIREDGKPCPLAWDGEILVPFCIESSLSGVGKELPMNHTLWYKTSFSVPHNWKGKHISLNFGAVDWKAQVFINGQLAAEHTGGYTPFSVDITPYLKPNGEQELTMSVIDPADRGYQPRGKQISHPHGIWYTSVSGIWQTVWMEPVSENHIVRVKTIPDLTDNSVNTTVLTSAQSENNIIEVSLYAAGACVATASGRAGESIKLTIANPKLWTPDSPFLYDMKIVLNGGDDEVASYTAMRSISTAKGSDGFWRMQLNGKNLFQYGPLDQGWWPDGLYTAPSDEALIYDIQMTKDLGFNMIRKHVKVEPERWYYHCDRLGILVWQDMPSGDLGNKWAPHTYEGGTDRERSDESKADYYDEWQQIMDFCMSHPSIVVWVPFNEAWGQFDTEKVTAWTKQYDPSRLVNPASGGNFVHAGDILDLHNYPEPKMYLFDPDRVNVLGEYGGIGLPLDGHLWWNNRNWGYIKFTNSDEVTAEYVRYAEQLAKFVSKGFSAAVYTQTSDVEGEVNGLMTYDRKVLKVNQDFVSKINNYVISQLK
ncbi:MAG: beta-galactosidase [Paludibacteraceae bacterium]|nr:beta-galactosidase [Paludibacteraceae bacterium]